VSPHATGDATDVATLPLPDDVRRFLDDSRRFAVIATINPDGSPHTAVVWYLIDERGIVVNSREGRRWPENLRRDPRMSFAVEAGVDWVSVRGVVDVIDNQRQAQADIAAMARKYDRHGLAELEVRDFETQQRVSFRLRPKAIHAELGGA